MRKGGERMAFPPPSLETGYPDRYPTGWITVSQGMPMRIRAAT